MKIGFFNDYQLGVVSNDRIVDIMPVLGEVHAHSPQQLISTVIHHWPDLEREVADYVKKNQGVALSGVKVRAPLPNPAYLVCMAVNYLEFGTRPMPDIDAFLKAPDSVIGDGDTVYMDPDCNATVFHHEAELAVVIGKPASRIKAGEAMDHVFGYTGFIDVSGRIRVRDAQSYYQTKSWPTFGPMGPFIVTKDEVPDPHNLEIRITNGGEPRQAFNTGDMAHKIPAALEFVTRITPLGPGDVVSTGTNHQGLGAIQDGDDLTLEVERIGALHVHVHDPLKREWPRGVDQAMADRMRGPSVRP